jgi:xanthine dehydrogenase accessory factor
MKQIKTWRLVHNSLQQNIPVMLLYVLQSTGSSPGRQGFFMAVDANGNMEGSVGGGIMEHKFVEMAKEKLKGMDSLSGFMAIRKQIHDKLAPKDQSGMICSGEQTLLLYAVQPGDAAPVDRVITTLQQHKNGTLILSPTGIRFEAPVPEKDFEFELHSEDDWLYREKTGYKNQLFIIGGGHCALALSKMMHPMDFYIRIYDERIELKTMLENDWAHEKHFINSYAGLHDLVPSGENHYVVIMTFGYRTDDVALRALAGKNFRFLGLMGSKAKIEQLFEEYVLEGINSDWLQRIHTPVGLDIKSQTPEEIAVSIAAQIIRVKNQHV